MTPQFLRSEAARFREMADSVTDREASKQRLLGMAIDYEARAKAAEEAQPIRQVPEAEPEPAADEAIAVEPSMTIHGDRRRRSTRTMTLPGASGRSGA